MGKCFKGFSTVKLRLNMFQTTSGAKTVFYKPCLSVPSKKKNNAGWVGIVFCESKVPLKYFRRKSETLLCRVG